MKKLKIITVCSGNICRSPMAKVMMESILKEAGIGGEVDSCGTLMIEGAPAAEHAREAVAEIGLDLSEHRSKGMVYDILKGSDAIIVMEPIHETFTKAIFSNATIVRLWEYSNKNKELIVDPVGRDLEQFRSARDEILLALTNWFDLCSNSLLMQTT